MQDAFVQAIRYKLQKRVRRLNSADYQHFPMLLRVFFQFFDSSPILSGVRDELLARVVEQDVPATVDRILNEGAISGYELKLLLPMNSVSGIPTDGKNIILITAVDEMLHTPHLRRRR